MMFTKKTLNGALCFFITVLCFGAQSSAQYTVQTRQQTRSYPVKKSRPSNVLLHDSRPHYLDYDDWVTDKKTRLWDVKLNRKPNSYSWTSRLVIANVVTYALQAINPAVTQWGVKISDRILRGEELYRLISPVFLHGSIYHLFTNMYSLQNVGHSCEGMFGSGRYLTGYLVAGATGNLLSAIYSPNPALGVSSNFDFSSSS